MNCKEIIYKDKTCFMVGEESSQIVIQPMDTHDIEELEKEWDAVQKPFTLLVVPIKDWNHELSPWSHPAVFGSEGFGDGANDTLEFILQDIIPSFKDANFYLAGYSLAGLFSLWASYQVDIFEGIVAASPSMWFQGFLTYTKENPILTQKVYLSLGDKEEFTKNPIMKTVGDNMREYYSYIQNKIPCVLEWNQGNHFKDSGLRVGKGINWIL